MSSMTKLQKYLTLAGVSLGVIASVIALWPIIGWTTPNRHIADVTVIQASLVSSSESIVEAIGELRDEWKCDEYDEELLDFEHQLADATRVEDVTRIQHDIDKIKAKMLKIDCSRFEDFG